jgi:hypothetical protein
MHRLASKVDFLYRAMFPITLRTFLK